MDPFRHQLLDYRLELPDRVRDPAAAALSGLALARDLMASLENELQAGPGWPPGLADLPLPDDLPRTARSHAMAVLGLTASSESARETLHAWLRPAREALETALERGGEAIASGSEPAGVLALVLAWNLEAVLPAFAGSERIPALATRLEAGPAVPVGLFLAGELRRHLGRVRRAEGLADDPDGTYRCFRRLLDGVDPLAGRWARRGAAWELVLNRLGKQRTGAGEDPSALAVTYLAERTEHPPRARAGIASRLLELSMTASGSASPILDPSAREAAVVELKAHLGSLPPRERTRGEELLAAFEDSD